MRPHLQLHFLFPAMLLPLGAGAHAASFHDLLPDGRKEAPTDALVEAPNLATPGAAGDALAGVTTDVETAPATDAVTDSARDAVTDPATDAVPDATPGTSLDTPVVRHAIAANDTASLFSATYAVNSAALDGARGGFITATGLSVTLGLERLVTINGNVIERTELQLGDLGKLTSGQASISSEAVGQLRLIQNGEVRAITSNAAGLLGGTIIQNSLNDQLINNQTAINATVNTGGMLRALNFGTSLTYALSTAIGPR